MLHEPVLLPLLDRALGTSCNCRGGGGRPCPKGWHTWPRASAPHVARAFLHKDHMSSRGMVYLNVPRAVAPAFVEAAAAVPGIELHLSDDRNAGFLRYRIDARAAARHPFLAEWAPRTVN